MIVRTGDHCEESVSRQMAPWRFQQEHSSLESSTDRLRADIGMPDLGLKAHVRRPKRIVSGDFDVDQVFSAFIWSVGGTEELAQQMCKIFAATRGIDYNLGVLVTVDIGEFLGDTPCSV